MRERPIGDLVSGLKQLGADVDCFLGTNCPPVRIIGKGGLPGGKVSLTLVLSDVTSMLYSIYACVFISHHIHTHISR
jgi:3-phosphoshikimate 1-carboxyvinyltransferase